MDTTTTAFRSWDTPATVQTIIDRAANKHDASFWASQYHLANCRRVQAAIRLERQAAERLFAAAGDPALRAQCGVAHRSTAAIEASAAVSEIRAQIAEAELADRALFLAQNPGGFVWGGGPEAS